MEDLLAVSDWVLMINTTPAATKIRGVGFCAFPIAVQPSLSSYATVVAS
jgi:hypothetical protein